MIIQWYPGHMNKALKIMEKDIKIVDAIIYVLDARAPFACLNPKFDKIIGEKPIIYILNKCDLGDAKKIESWSKYLNDGKNVCLTLNSTASGSAKKLETAIIRACSKKVQKYKEKNIKLILRAMVIGVPNSGKSTLVNNLSGSAKAKAANTPGVTRSTQWVRLGNQIEVLDTPGTLWPAFDNEKVAHHLAYIGSISEDVLDINELCIDFIKEIRELDQTILENRYSIEIEEIDEAIDILEKVCTKRGFLLRGGELDYDRGCYAIINDFKQGKLGSITLEAVEDIKKLSIKDRKSKD